MRLIEHTPKKWAEFIRTRNPIAESIVPLNSRGNRTWSRMSSDWMVAHARWARKNIGVESRKELKKADQGLYQALRKRKLLDEIELEVKNRDFSTMDVEELIGLARVFIAKNGVGERMELARADRGLYLALMRRKLLDGLGFERKNRNWAAMGDEELVDFAKEFIVENGVESRSELEKTDRGLYLALMRRKLLNGVGLRDLRGEIRSWTVMDNGELVGFAKGFIAEKGVGGRHDLEKEDQGLYQALRKRKLLDKIGLGSSNANNRDWISYSDEELIAFGERFSKERGISGRKELMEEDRGLYRVLRKRKLLDDVFADVERQRHADAVQGVLDALESFGDDL